MWFPQDLWPLLCTCIKIKKRRENKKRRKRSQRDNDNKKRTGIIFSDIFRSHLFHLFECAHATSVRQHFSGNGRWHIADFVFENIIFHWFRPWVAQRSSVDLCLFESLFIIIIPVMCALLSRSFSRYNYFEFRFQLKPIPTADFKWEKIGRRAPTKCIFIFSPNDAPEMASCMFELNQPKSQYLYIVCPVSDIIVYNSNRWCVTMICSFMVRSHVACAAFSHFRRAIGGLIIAWLWAQNARHVKTRSVHVFAFD